MKDKEREYKELEAEVTEDITDFFEEEVDYDNLSNHYCDSCGNRLLKEEYEEFEDTCSDCMYEMIPGLDNLPDEDEEE